MTVLMKKTAKQIADEVVSKTEEPSFLSRHAPLIAGLGLGGLGYGLSRTRFLSGSPTLRKLQQAATKNYYHTPYDQLAAQDYKSLPWYSKAWRRLSQGPEKFLEYDKRGRAVVPEELLNKIRKGEASLYDYRTQQALGGKDIPGWTPEGRRMKWGITPKKRSIPDLEDKLFEMQLLQRHAPEAAIRSKGLADIMRKNKIKLNRAADFRKLREVLKKEFPEGFYMKPRANDASSAGIFASEEHDLFTSYKDWKKLRPEYRKTQADTEKAIAAGKEMDPNTAVYKHRSTPGYEGRIFEDLSGRGTMVQAKAPLIVDNKGLENEIPREYRVHIVGGKAVPFTGTKRYGPTAGVPSISGRRAAKWLEKHIQSLPEKYQGIPFAADVAALEGGGHKVVELNPTMASGIMGSIPFSGQNMYKHMTGRYTPEMSAIRGLGLGAVGAGVTAGGQALHRMGTHESDT